MKTANEMGLASFEEQERELQQQIEAGERARAQLEALRKEVEASDLAKYADSFGRFDQRAQLMK
ncbi:hypothetical protein V5O48_001509 [Marasmius crinis-equi]|uniref:Uncharacterized protein n=1 Tax=Marasmius crinis-equi TaxID=585013 RepID=A0ABR3FYA7_9AGAR